MAETLTPTRSPEMEPDREAEQAFQYRILTPTAYHSADTETAQELQEKYITLTSNLIQKMAGNKDSPPYDSVVFLDKSARPLAWMVKELWPHVAPQKVDEETGEVITADMPDIKFANIDRNNWRRKPNKPFEHEDGGKKPITDEDVDGLRSIFHINDSETLEGKRVLIVDEQRETGDTLNIAEDLFRRAFSGSGATFEPFSWVTHRQNGRLDDVREIPVWYPQKTTGQDDIVHDETGRGVYNPRRSGPPANKSYLRSSRIQKGGWQFMSTAPVRTRSQSELSSEERKERARLESEYGKTEDPNEQARISSEIQAMERDTDKKSVDLRREIGQMVVDFTNGRLFPLIKADRVEILGKDPVEYNREATKKRPRRRRNTHR